MPLSYPDTEFTADGLRHRAKAWMVVPEAKMMESLGSMSFAACCPIASFSAGAIFSFSFTDLLMVNGLMAMALP